MSKPVQPTEPKTIVPRASEQDLGRTTQQHTQALVNEITFSREIIESIAEGLCIFHVVEPQPEVQFTVWNPQMEKITGYTMEEINHLGWYQSVYQDPDVRARAVARIKMARVGVTLSAEEWQITRKDGHKRWLSVVISIIDIGQGNPQALGLMSDITEQKLAGEILMASEQKFSQIFHHSPQAIALTRLADSTFADVNETFLDLSGFTREEIIGRTPEDLNIWVDIEQRKKLVELISTNHMIQNFETTMRNKSGKLHIFLMSGVIVEMNDEPHLILMGIDITERKEIEEERLKLASQYQQLQKLESLGVLAGGIAHDFNNLLMGIIGNGDLMSLELTSDSPLKLPLNEILDAASQAAQLSQQMLAYSGKGRFFVEALDLNNSIRDMISLLQSSVAQKAVLELQLKNALPTIDADATQMQQVIMNLVTNAAESLEERPSTKITIRTGHKTCSRDYLDGNYFQEPLVEGDYVFIEVSDSGNGMTDEVKERIFDPFFSTKFTGRGLGLAATLGIVRGHGGAIFVQSAPGRGSTFRILFPASERSAPKQLESRQPGASHEASKGRILVVDDEETVRNVVTQMLERGGFEVITAVDGHDAIDKYKNTQPRFDCVILDYSMPTINGAQTARELSKIDDDICILLSSGYTEHQADLISSDTKVAGFIQKPYRYQSLMDKLETLLKWSD